MGKNSPDCGSFEFESWSVYRKSLLFAKEAHQLCGGFSKQGNRSISDQLRRASQSIPLNIAEGSSRYTKKDKVNFLRIARGSVFECAAVLDLIRELDLSQQTDLGAMKTKLAELGRMLSGFINYIENNQPKRRSNP